MTVLSVDLATRRWSDLGIVVLGRTPSHQAANPAEAALGAPQLSDPTSRNSGRGGGPIHCEILSWADAGPVDANKLAGRLNHLCGVRGIRVMMLDGPQAWKSRHNGLEHARVSERHLNTAAKTGLPGMVKPATYRAFAEFCLDVYDALCRRGWRRLATREQPGSAAERVLVESYPFAAWKSLGLKPLAAKRRTRVSDLAERFGALRTLIPLTVNRPPNHDQLQAIVGGLPGLALEEHNPTEARIVGSPPRREEGQWREGFIVLPVAPIETSWLNGMHWLD